LTTTDPLSTDFSYKKYSLQQLDNWVNDAVNCVDLTPQDIYDTVIKCVDESVEYHKKYYTRSVELLSLLKGNRPVEFDYTATGEKFPTATKKDWIDFWEEIYYPEESKKSQQVKADGYSVHYYDYTRNDPNRINPFTETPDYTELPE